MEQLIEDLLEFARSPAYGPILGRALEYEDRVRERGDDLILSDVKTSGMDSVKRRRPEDETGTGWP